MADQIQRDEAGMPLLAGADPADEIRGDVRGTALPPFDATATRTCIPRRTAISWAAAAALCVATVAFAAGLVAGFLLSKFTG